MSASLRLADLLGGLSIAADLGFGLPPEEAMRSCLIGTALARERGLTEEEVSDCFYTALLMHLGCSALSHETAVAFGDEHVVLSIVARTNVADPDDIATTLLPELTRGRSRAERARLEHYAVTHGQSSAAPSTPAAARWRARLRGGWGWARVYSEPCARPSNGGAAKVPRGGCAARRSPFRPASLPRPPTRRASTGSAVATPRSMRCGAARARRSIPRSSSSSPRRPIACSSRPARVIRASSCSSWSRSRSWRSMLPSCRGSRRPSATLPT